MSERSYNMIRVVGSDVWFGVDVARKELMMQRGEKISIIADFRSTEAAELVDVWFVSLFSKFHASKSRSWFR